MGKNLPQQRRGRGLPGYRSPSHRYIGELKYTMEGAAKGKIADIVHSTGKQTPVAIADFGGKKELLVAVNGLAVGQTVEYGGDVQTGNIVEIGKVPEGTPISNIELRPGDGGKICRSPGSAAMVVTRGATSCVVQLPSKKQVQLSSACRATVGTPAGSGRSTKPFAKAGKIHHAMRATGRLWPTTSAVSKNPVDHPFGGKTKPGTPITISRQAPPGAKVGSVAARRTGKKKR
jgi:large subunit ribosomal protein L2